MVFNSGFDSTLWLILASDKKHRKEMAKFIYSIPNEVYDSICKQLIEYQDGIKDISYGFKSVKKLIRTDDYINCFYDIEMCPYKIKIKLKRWDSANDKFNEDIELLLYYCNINELNNMEYPVCLGNYSYNGSRFLNPFSSFLIVNSDDMEYEIYDNNDIEVMISGVGSYEFDKIINLNNIHQELELSDLRDGRSVNKLVRGRKKK